MPLCFQAPIPQYAQNTGMVKRWRRHAGVYFSVGGEHCKMPKGRGQEEAIRLRGSGVPLL